MANVSTSGMGQFRQILLYAIVIGFVTIGVFMIAAGETMMGMMALCFFGGCGVVFLAEPAGRHGRRQAEKRRAVSAKATTFHFNAFHLGVMALGGGLMATGAGFMAANGAPVWVAWPAIVLGAATALLLAWRATDRRPVVVIDAKGLFDRRLLRAPLRWDDIYALDFDGSYGVPFMVIHPVEGAALSTRKRQLRIADTLLDGTLADMLAAIHHFRPQVIIVAPDD